MSKLKSRAAAALLAAASVFAWSPAFAAGDHAGHHASEGGDAIGQPGDASRVSRTIVIDMSDDMRFTPSEIAVRAGETIRFLVRNAGRLRHEMVIGSDADLKAHYAAMLKMPEMEHADPNAVTLDAGKSGELVWHFTRGGRVPFACLQPGHFDAGMRGQIRVR
ncbi:plastocyanin/azurin family copper-binding protein [Cupriavidus sp. 2TAF22]|uniref:cupredoxin domain-containing protein n=1 Tax=unclassified Cupriavidus TaxID=2640874 RepID=UPI003F8EC9DB